MLIYSGRAFLLFFLFARFGLVLGNTEIVNFASVPSPGTDVETQFPDISWQKLDVLSGIRQFELSLAPYGQPWSDVCRLELCKHEMFVELGLEKSHDVWGLTLNKEPRYSLRISWPASTPADFDIEIYTPTELQVFLSSRGLLNSTIPVRPTSSPLPAQTRTMYARIRARDAGVRAPADRTWHLFPPLVPLPSNTPTVGFHLVLDPLLLGFIPQSVVPTIGMILLAIMVGLYVAKRLTPYMQAVSIKANKQLVALGAGEKEE